jgi:hypothetical protein
MKEIDMFKHLAFAMVVTLAVLSIASIPARAQSDSDNTVKTDSSTAAGYKDSNDAGSNNTSMGSDKNTGGSTAQDEKEESDIKRETNDMKNTNAGDAQKNDTTQGTNP